MDPTLPIIALLLSLTSGNYSGGGLEIYRKDVSGMFTFSTGQLIQYNAPVGQEVRGTYYYGSHMLDRFNSSIDFSITDAGGLWVGAGFYQQFNMDIAGGQFFSGFNFAPGLYLRGNEVRLGHPIEFRSGAEFGMRFDGGWQASIAYDHRSNALLSSYNPGMETVELRISKEFN